MVSISWRYPAHLLLIQTASSGVIAVNHRINFFQKEFFNRKETNKSINPDEAVEYGAVIGSAIMTNVKD